MSRSSAGGVLLTALLALAGCGGSDNDSTAAPTTSTPSPPPPRETSEQLPKLPRRWSEQVDRRGGFAFGLPPGWTASDRGAGSLIRSYDRLVAISVVADRTEAARETELPDYVTDTADALPGFRGELDVKGMFPFADHYQTTQVKATGIAEGGVEQKVLVIALRRGRIVTVTAVIAANAKHAAADSVHLAKRVVHTLRTRPPRPSSR